MAKLFKGIAIDKQQNKRLPTDEEKNWLDSVNEDF